MVGTRGEETGCYMPDLLKLLEKCPFLSRVLPWGSLSKLSGQEAGLSNDGPILWVRPGEQSVTANSKLGARGSGLQQMYSSAGGTRAARQTLVTDRTHAHADHADDGFDRHTTAAVGLLRAVRPGRDRRVVKDAIFFDPRHYGELIVRLQLDIMEPPVRYFSQSATSTFDKFTCFNLLCSQCPNLWLEDAEMNLLRREGFRYTRQQLRDADIYFIPRGVVHQFKTLSATASIAWHVR